MSKPEHAMSAKKAIDGGSNVQNARRGARIFAVFTLGSRVLGLIRDQVLIHIFGAIATMDLFWFAFTIPNLFRRLVAEGALQGALVPIFCARDETSGRDASGALIAQVFWLALALVGGLTALGVLFSPWLVGLVAGGITNPHHVEMCVTYTRLLFPYMLCMSLLSVWAGGLQGRHRYGSVALAPIVLNLTWIAAVVLFRDSFEDPIFAMIAGILVGGVIQVAIQLPSIRSEGFQLLPRRPWLSEDLRALGSRIAPQVFALGAYQLNVVVLRYFASRMPEGSMTYYYNADRLVQVAYGIFAVSIATASLTAMSVSKSQTNEAAVLTNLFRAIRSTNFWLSASSIGLFVLSDWIVAGLYEHGAFSGADTLLMTPILKAMAFWLLLQGWIRPLTQWFFVEGDTKTPVLISLAGMVSMLALASQTYTRGPQALGWALSVSAIVYLMFFIGLFLKRLQNEKNLARCLMKDALRENLLLVAFALLVFVAIRLAVAALVFSGETLWLRVMRLMVAVLPCAILYLAFGRLMKLGPWSAREGEL